MPPKPDMSDEASPAGPASSSPASSPATSPDAKLPLPRWKNNVNNNININLNNSNNSPKAVANQGHFTPSNCIVLKNLDYNVTRESLGEVIRSLTPPNRSFVHMNFVDDKATGVFRGVAFVTFPSIADAATAMIQLGKLNINGRKVIAEYRRTRAVQDKRPKKGPHDNPHPPHHTNNNPPPFHKNASADKRAMFFANRENDRRANDNARKNQNQTQNQDSDADRSAVREDDFRKLLLKFANGSLRSSPNVTQQISNSPPNENANINASAHLSDGDDPSPPDLPDPLDPPDVLEVDEMEANDMVFDSSLTSYERRMVHIICDELKLGHISQVDDEGNRSLHVTRDPERTAAWARESAALGLPRAQGGGPRANAAGPHDLRRREPTRNGNGGADGGLVGGTEEDSAAVKMNYFRPKAMALGDKAVGANVSGGILPPSYRVYTPAKQPSGPDGTGGFIGRRVFHGMTLGEDDKGKEDGPGKGDGKGDGNGAEDHVGKTLKGKGRSLSKGRKMVSQSALDPSVPAFAPMNSL